MSVSNRVREEYIDWCLVISITVIAFSTYALCNVGRIDIIDGQWRFEVAYNLVRYGSVQVLDPAIKAWGIIGRDGLVYSGYGIAGSVMAFPLVAIANWYVPGNKDVAQLRFSFASPLVGAFLLGSVFYGYRLLGVSRRRAMKWTMVLGFSTIVFPLSTSTFDQAQHAFFLFVAVMCAYRANTMQSAAIAVWGVIAFAVLAGYQVAYLILWPSVLWLAGLRRLSDYKRKTRDPGPIRTYWLGGFIIVLLLACFNLARFGIPLAPSGQGGHPPVLGNTLNGFLMLTVSPGKSIFWYSPTIFFALAGWGKFKLIAPELAKAVLLLGATWLLLISTLSFAGGDWCWGPRYILPLLPLAFLAAPFCDLSHGLRRVFGVLILVFGFTVQVLSISVDHQRFFFERNLEPFFWYKNSDFYYHESPIISRLNELRSIRVKGNIDAYQAFRPGPYSESYTYTFFGPKHEDRLDITGWMNRYAVFWLPRPWVLWSLSIKNDDIQSYRERLTFLLVCIGLAGLSALIFIHARSALDN